MGVLFISNGVDASALIQQLKKINYNGKLYGTTWTKTNYLLSHGGKTVEGMKILALFKTQKKSVKQINFERQFFQKYQKKPTYASMLTYDAFQILIYGLTNSKNSSPIEVKKTILKKRRFQGIEQMFEVNRFGDTVRPYAVFMVSNRSFILEKQK